MGRLILGLCMGLECCRLLHECLLNLFSILCCEEMIDSNGCNIGDICHRHPLQYHHPSSTSCPLWHLQGRCLYHEGEHCCFPKFLPKPASLEAQLVGRSRLTFFFSIFFVTKLNPVYVECSTVFGFEHKV